MPTPESQTPRTPSASECVAMIEAEYNARMDALKLELAQAKLESVALGQQVSALQDSLNRAKTSIETSLATALERDALKQQRDTYRKQLFPKDGCAPNCQCNECQLKQQVERLKAENEARKQDVMDAVKSVLEVRDLLDPYGSLSIQDAAKNLRQQVKMLKEEKDETHRCLLNREQTLKQAGYDWVKVKTELDIAHYQLTTSAAHNAKLREALVKANNVIDAAFTFYRHREPMQIVKLETVKTLVSEALSNPPDQALSEWVECLKMIVESAVPHPTTNTAMFKAWEKARQLLGQNTQTPK